MKELQGMMAFLGRSLMLVLLLTGAARSAAAQQVCWTVAGSTGVVDEGDLSAAVETNSNLLVSSAVNTTVDARYSVTGIRNDDNSSARGKRLVVRYRDNGAEAQVRAFLHQLNIFSGTSTQLVTFNSNDPLYPQSSSFQWQWLFSSCFVGGGFDFINNLYYVEVEVTKTGGSGNPAIQAIQVCETIC